MYVTETGGFALAKPRQTDFINCTMRTIVILSLNLIKMIVLLPRSTVGLVPLIRSLDIISLLYIKDKYFYLTQRTHQSTSRI